MVFFIGSIDIKNVKTPVVPKTPPRKVCPLIIENAVSPKIKIENKKIKTSNPQAKWLLLAWRFTSISLRCLDSAMPFSIIWCAASGSSFWYSFNISGSGVDIYVISKRLGHANITTTLDVYANLLKEYKTKQDNKIISLLNDL